MIDAIKCFGRIQYPVYTSTFNPGRIGFAPMRAFTPENLIRIKYLIWIKLHTLIYGKNYEKTTGGVTAVMAVFTKNRSGTAPPVWRGY